MSDPTPGRDGLIQQPNPLVPTLSPNPKEWACREVYKNWEGKQAIEYHGLVNHCMSGLQCEGHACYCLHPDSGRNKCGIVGWGKRYEDSIADGYDPCPVFKANPHYAGDMESTFANLKAAGLTGPDMT